MENAAIDMISEASVAPFLRPDFILPHVETTMRGIGNGTVKKGDKAYLHLDDEGGLRTFVAMTGALTNDAICGVKWVGTIAGNAERNRPRAPAAVILTDSITGEMQAVVEATAITAWRTAAAAVVTAKHCTRWDIGKVALIGFGAVGHAAAALADAAFAPERIDVWGPRHDAVEASLQALRPGIDADLVARRGIADATADADVVITSTGLSEDQPFLTLAMLDEPVCVCTLGSYQELCADVFAQASAIVIDDWKACSQRGSLGPLVRSGQMDRNAISAEVCDVTAAGGLEGPVGGSIVACLCGLGALDIAIAHAIRNKLMSNAD